MSQAINDQYRRFYEFAYGWTPPTFTYIVSCEGTDLLKFGKSATPEWRLQCMQTGCPFRLEIKWCWPEDIELEMHQTFARWRVTGEWFRVPLDVAITVAANLSKEKYRKATLNHESIHATNCS